MKLSRASHRFPRDRELRNSFTDGTSIHVSNLLFHICFTSESDFSPTPTQNKCQHELLLKRSAPINFEFVGHSAVWRRECCFLISAVCCFDLLFQFTLANNPKLETKKSPGPMAKMRSEIDWSHLLFGFVRNRKPYRWRRGHWLSICVTKTV